MTGAGIAYYRYDAINPALLRALFGSEYAPDHPTLDPRFLDWLYRANPAGGGGFILARHRNGDLRGSIGLVPFRITWGDREITAYVALHVLVHPAERGARLFDDMIGTLKAHLAEQETFLLGHPNPTASPAWIRCGMHFRDDYCLGWNGRLLDAKLGSYRSITSADEIARLDFSGLTAWRHSRGSPVLAADARFLVWRFLAHPIRRYHLRLRVEGNRVLGYVAIGRMSGVDVILDWQGERELADGPPGRFMRPAFVSDPKHAPAIAHARFTKRIPMFATGFAVTDAQRSAPWDGVTLAACDFL